MWVKKTDAEVEQEVRDKYYRWLTRQQKVRIIKVDNDTVDVIGITSWYFATQFVEKTLKVSVVEWETRTNKDLGYIHRMLIEEA